MTTTDLDVPFDFPEKLQHIERTKQAKEEASPIERMDEEECLGFTSNNPDDHCFQFDSNNSSHYEPLHVNRKPSYLPPPVQLVEVESVDSDSEHPRRETRDDEEPSIGQRQRRDNVQNGKGEDEGTSNTEGVDPYDYMDSIHSRLSSVNFHRDDKAEDYIDHLFEKIESLACEMDGEPETLKDLLDEVFEFFEDIICGKTARRRNAAFRASFEKFLQKIDRAAALVPNDYGGGGETENEDLLDKLCRYFEDANGTDYYPRKDFLQEGKWDQKMIDDLLPNSDSIFEQRNHEEVMVSVDSNHVHSLLSISEETPDVMLRYRGPLRKITEEGSTASDRTRSRRKVTDGGSFASERTYSSNHFADEESAAAQQIEKAPRVSTPRPRQLTYAERVENYARLRKALTRGNNLRRLRGNIHAGVSTKDVVKKVTECRDTINEAFGSAGEQISSAGLQLFTVFDGMVSISEETHEFMMQDSASLHKITDEDSMVFDRTQSRRELAEKLSASEEPHLSPKVSEDELVEAEQLEEAQRVSTPRPRQLTYAEQVENQARLRNELVRRNNLKRMRGNIHAGVSAKDAVKKLTECCDTINEALDSTGEQMSSAGAQWSTVFDGMVAISEDQPEVMIQDSASLHKITEEGSTAFDPTQSRREPFDPTQSRREPTDDELFASEEPHSSLKVSEEELIEAEQLEDSQRVSIPLPRQLTYAKQVENQARLRNELNRRNNLKRMRGNIHVGVSTKDVMKTVTECCDTINEALDSAGEQISSAGAQWSTVFDGIVALSEDKPDEMLQYGVPLRKITEEDSIVSDRTHSSRKNSDQASEPEPPHSFLNFAEEEPALSEQLQEAPRVSTPRPRQLTYAEQVENQARLRKELIRRNNLKRLRGNVHGRISTKDVVKKVTECRDTVNEVFGSAGEQISSAGLQLSTVFEGIELEKLWDNLILGSPVPCSTRQDTFSEGEVATDGLASHEIPDNDCIEESRELIATETLALVPSNSVAEVVIKAQNETVSCSSVHSNDHESLEHDIILATSSEETYASGCGAGRSAQRLEKVEVMKRIQNGLFKERMADVGRMTPNSAFTEPTCDESHSDFSTMEKDHSGRRLLNAESGSSRFERMEMITYLSFQDPSRHSERCSHGIAPVSLGPLPENKSGDRPDDKIPGATFETMTPRLGEAPEEVFFSSDTLNHTESLDNEELDPSLGRASNRSNRSLFLSDSGNISACTMDEMPRIPSIPTAKSDNEMDEDTTLIRAESCPSQDQDLTSFVTARSCLSEEGDEDEDEPSVFSFLSAKSELHKIQSSVYAEILDDVHGDELGRIMRSLTAASNDTSSTPRPKSSGAASSTELVRADGRNSYNSWFSFFTKIFKGKDDDKSWIGSQTMHAMMLLVYVSTSVAKSSNDGSVKERFEQRKREFHDKMMNKTKSNKSDVPGDEETLSA